MMLTFKYRLYPTKAQVSQFETWFESLRELQNSMRGNRKHAYEENEGDDRFVSRYDQDKLLRQARKKYDDIQSVPEAFQEQVLRRVDEAFMHFRRRVKENAEKKGYPRYRKKIRSFAWRIRSHQTSPIVETDCRHNLLKVPKLGKVKIRQHRPLRGVPKQVSIVKKASGWYAMIACDVGETLKTEPTDAIAVDMGTMHYLTTSEGEKVDNPRWYRQGQNRLRILDKRKSRHKGGRIGEKQSNRYKKANRKCSLHHEKTANRRKDFIRKLAYKLFHHYRNNVLIAEDLKTANMVQNKHLSKSISDASWATFFNWAGNIAERDGFHFHQVDPKNTSQTCSACGQKADKKLSLSVRTFNCKHCGHSLDRDHNAALNILFRAATARCARGEKWSVDALNEARSMNTLDYTNAKQLLLFDAVDLPAFSHD